MARIGREAPALDHAGWWLTGALIYGVLVLSRSLRGPVRRRGRRMAETIYTSPNGDRWTLLRDTASGEMVVRHEPNQASGGRTSDTGVEAFLSRTGQAPEGVALRRLLGHA